MQQKLSANQAKVGLPPSSGKQVVQVGASASMRNAKPTSTAKKPSPPKAKEKRALEEGEEPALKKSKGDNPCHPKLVN